VQQFDPNLLNSFNQPLMQGDVTAVLVREPGGIVAGLSNNVVDPNQAFDVRVDWTIFGGLVPLWIAALDPTLTNPWSVDVYAESIGGGQEIRIGGAQVATNLFTPDPDPAHILGRQYTATVTVPAGTLQEGNPGSNVSGVYKLAAVVFLDSNLGVVGYDLAGFSEGPIIEVESLI
jgi:hypothetical protein